MNSLQENFPQKLSTNLSGDDVKITREQARKLFLTCHPNIKLETRFVDPGKRQYFVFNFIPDTEAIPGKSGSFGFLKVRCVSDNVREIEEKSLELIQKYDQLATNIIWETGKPVPIFKDDNLYDSMAAPEDIEKVDVSKTYSHVRSDFIKAQKERDQKIQEEIEQKRERMLALEDSGDKMYDYAINISKIVSWIKTLKDLEDACAKLQGQIKHGVETIDEMDSKDQSLRQGYLSYIAAEEEKMGLRKGKSDELDQVIKRRHEELANWRENIPAAARTFADAQTETIE